MRSLLILLALPALAADRIVIDHVTIAGEHLETMRKAFAAETGVTPEYGGPHSNHATEMALVSFPDGSYLELMGIQPKPDPKAVDMHVWSKFLRNNAGPCAFAIRIPDVAAEVARLKSAGVPVGIAERSGRTRPDGVKLDWETATVGPGARGSLFPFLIRDMTPREKRVYPSGKATTDRFGGVAQVVIGVRDLAAATAQYQRAFGLPEPLMQRDDTFGATLAWFQDTPVVLAQGTLPDSWITRRVRDYGEGPCAFILAARGGMKGSTPSKWFGHAVFWAREDHLGWRLGIQTP
jgi:catechol 2,3-dioxygenase-like lactoylglutathione lyase family enzyme